MTMSKDKLQREWFCQNCWLVFYYTEPTIIMGGNYCPFCADDINRAQDKEALEEQERLNYERDEV